MEHMHSTHNNIYKISLAFIRDEVSEIFFIVHEELFYQDCLSCGVSLLAGFFHLQSLIIIRTKKS